MVSFQEYLEEHSPKDEENTFFIWDQFRERFEFPFREVWDNPRNYKYKSFDKCLSNIKQIKEKARRILEKDYLFKGKNNYKILSPEELDIINKIVNFPESIKEDQDNDYLKFKDRFGVLTELKCPHCGSYLHCLDYLPLYFSDLSKYKTEYVCNNPHECHIFTEVEYNLNDLFSNKFLQDHFNQSLEVPENERIITSYRNKKCCLSLTFRATFNSTGIQYKFIGFSGRDVIPKYSGIYFSYSKCRTHTRNYDDVEGYTHHSLRKLIDSVNNIIYTAEPSNLISPLIKRIHLISSAVIDQKWIEEFKKIAENKISELKLECKW
jgi:hypothetical protein